MCMYIYACVYVYIYAFMGLNLLYDFTWRDVMCVLEWTLTPDAKTRALGKLLLLEMNGLNVRQRERGNMK